MKKISKFIFVIIACLFITGCKKENNKDKTSVEEIEKWIIENVETEIADDISLPTAYKDNSLCTIKWESINKALDNTGKIVLHDSKIKEVVMNYTIANEANEEKSGSITIKIYPKTLDAIATSFVNQIPDEIYEDLSLETIYYDCYTVEWSSSDTSVLTDDGTYIKPQADIMITISYRVKASDTFYKDYSKEVKVVNASVEEKLEGVSKWIQEEFITNLMLEEDLVLPTLDPTYNLELEWITSDPTIITNKGKITRYVFTRYLELRCNVKINNTTKSFTFWMAVKPLDISEMSQKDILENFISAIAVKELSQLKFTAYTNISQTFNGLHFYDNIDVERIKWIAPLDKDSGHDNRPGIKKTSTEFIVVHDTANPGRTANGLAHAKYVSDGGGGTSFQYVVGNDGVYNLIPDDEVAYHAADGRRLFGLIDTGLKATSRLINVTTRGGYFYFNNQKSNVKIPEGAGELTKMVSSGIYYEIGENGNWWINTSYYNSRYGMISNQGGNRNSIGIETCVNETSDYYTTLRFNADLIGTLLIENNLDVLRVLQHNSMCGKECPAALRAAHYWQNFRDMISLEKFGKEHFKDLTFTWVSGTSILDNQGYIKKDIGSASEVKYSVCVKEGNDVIFQSEYTTKLIK